MGLALALALSAALPAGAGAFGTWNGVLGQRGEHERVTRTLSCDASDRGPHCLQDQTLDQLAGRKGLLGGVGQPDAIAETVKGPASKHCDNGDFLNTPGYPRTRAQATEALTACIDRFDAYMDAAVGQAGKVAGTDLKIDKDEVALDVRGGGIEDCDVYDSVAGEAKPARAKCGVIANLGRAAHIVQDFWSHSNWGDRQGPGGVGPSNPPGLNFTASPDFFRYPRAGLTIPNELATGCDDTTPLVGERTCRGRINHGSGDDPGINKDKGRIDPLTGAATDATTYRGRFFGGANFQAAVTGARMQTRTLYGDFAQAVKSRYGTDRGEAILRGMGVDAPWTSCARLGGEEKGAFAPPRRLPDGYFDHSVTGSLVNRTGQSLGCLSAALTAGHGWGALPQRPFTGSSRELAFSSFGVKRGAEGRMVLSIGGTGATVVLRWDNPLAGYNAYGCEVVPASANFSCKSDGGRGNQSTVTYEIVSRPGRSARSGGSAARAGANVPGPPPRGTIAKSRLPRGLTLKRCGKQRGLTPALGILRQRISCKRAVAALERALLRTDPCPEGWRGQKGIRLKGFNRPATGRPPLTLCWAWRPDGDGGRRLRAFTYAPALLLG